MVEGRGDVDHPLYPGTSASRAANRTGCVQTTTSADPTRVSSRRATRPRLKRPHGPYEIIRARETARAAAGRVFDEVVLADMLHSLARLTDDEIPVSPEQAAPQISGVHGSGDGRFTAAASGR